jgi:hypothetical protein
MGVYISGLHSFRKKKKTHFTSFMNFNHFGEPQLLHTRIPNIQRFLISICHIFIPSIPFFTFFCFSFFFFFFWGNFLLINNHRSRNNICDLRSLSYNKLVDEDKNGNVILSLTRILGKFNTENKNVKILFLCP